MNHGSPNFFVRGPHKLMQNLSRAGRHTECDCCGICYILQNQKIFRKDWYYFFIIDKMAWRAGWNVFAGRSLETPLL